MFREAADNFGTLTSVNFERVTSKGTWLAMLTKSEATARDLARKKKQQRQPVTRYKESHYCFRLFANYIEQHASTILCSCTN